ncbi:MAG TPA: hypothetical protein VMJ66_07060 [Geobacteraceae bacterium]|nr:hypothetical protein [Geobacteraceae bacterium]
MTSKNRPLLERNWFWIALISVILIGFFSQILFTGKIIRASDVITQLFWNVKAVKEQSFPDYLRSFPAIFQADWDPLSDGGRTLEGGWNAIYLLCHRYLIQHFFPFPADIAWLVVLAMCWGAAGTFLYCRLIGIGRFGAFVSSLIYVLCTENASLINAGHIQKLEAICWFPWALLFLEKALRSGRPYHYAMAALMLAIQFFHMHWQISFYSCLAMGGYWIFHVLWRFITEKGTFSGSLFGKQIILASFMVVLFFSTIAMSFAPLVSWSQQSERGDTVAGSASVNGSTVVDKGIGFDEGMSWSLPPEEILTFFVPGLFGYSRQEAGDVPGKNNVYYWGRMRFTQTGDYLGLLPWLLLPLPLLLRRDRYIWFFTCLMTATLIMALGRYTFVYPLMFKYLPAFSKFRVPKMVLFLFAFGASVLAGRGIDILTDEAVERNKLSWWLGWCAGIAALAGILLIGIRVGGHAIAGLMGEYLAAPTRFQSGIQLISDRLGFMLRECGITFVMGSLYLAAIFAWFRKWLPARALLALLVILMLGDLWRVNYHFITLTTPPSLKVRETKNDVVEFLKPRIDHYRMQPLNDENAHYYANCGLANISAYVTISERRYRQFLDTFNLMSPMPDLMNLKYLLIANSDFVAQKTTLAGKYAPVFSSAKGSVVLENRTVLPKAWLVPSAAMVADPRQRLGIMNADPRFNPARIALVESQPPLPMAPYGEPVSAGSARVDSYMPNRIIVTATANMNALLVLGEKYYRWWYATVDGKPVEIQPVDHILRGVYLNPGDHRVEFVFDPLPFKIGKYLTLASLAFYFVLIMREIWLRRRGPI